MDKSSLGDRMKKAYEGRSRTYLTRRTPVILRLDGKAFHTFTRGYKKPFDDKIINAMRNATKYLVDNIQGARIGFTQSDEISILICDYDRLESEAWFEFNVQKMCSVAASMATAEFNYRLYEGETLPRRQRSATLGEDMKVEYTSPEPKKFANFDCRAFNIPKEEVANYFLWRYQDWARNCISMVAQSMFSHKELQNKPCSEMSEMIKEKGWIWKMYHPCYEHGTHYVRGKYLQGDQGDEFCYPDLRLNRAWIDHAVEWTQAWQDSMDAGVKKAQEDAEKLLGREHCVDC